MENDKDFVFRNADAASRKELAVFASWVLGFKNADHHREWYDILQNRLMTPKDGNWDSDLVPADKPNNLIALLAPRSHSKSTSFTVNYSLWRLGLDPNIRILIVSASQSQSEAFLREIKAQMTLNPHYRRVFGDLFPAEALSNVMSSVKWTNTEIIANRSNPKLKDPTVAVSSAGGSVLGRRADLIIVDDVLNEKNTKTAEQREKIKEWYESVLLPVLEPDGQLIVVGTAWFKEDLYHKIMELPIYDVRKRYKAILDDEKGKVLWEERWSYKKLMERKKQVGSLAFNKSYQNEALSPEDAVFQSEWTDEAKRKGKSRTFIQALDYAKWDMGYLTISIGVDLAISQKDDSDFTAMAVVGQTADGIKLPLYLSREKLSPAQTKSKIVALTSRYNPQIVVVESNAYQKSLTLDLADTTSVPVKAYTTGGEKYDPDIGINSLAIDFENGKWILPYSPEDPYAQDMIDKLVGGMLDYPSGHTEDLLMALWFANNGLRTLTGTQSRVRTGKTSDVFGR